MKLWAGIDPGANGSMCLLYENGDTAFVDFKSNKLSGYIDCFEVLIREGLLPSMIAIEAVSSMPGQGVKSMFSFGQRYGELQGMLSTFKLGFDIIRPQQWQKACHVVPKSGKKGVYETMSRLYPSAELSGPKGGILDGRCDALGLAHYLRITYP